LRDRVSEPSVQIGKVIKRTYSEKAKKPYVSKGENFRERNFQSLKSQEGKVFKGIKF
jgi:hypothetical protein